MPLLVNGRTLEADGATVTDVSAWLSSPGVVRDTVTLPNVRGVLPASRRTSGARRMRVAGYVRAATLAQRVAIVQSLRDRLAGPLLVRTPDWPARVIRAECVELGVQAIGGSAFGVPELEFFAELVSYDGASYDAEPRVVAFSSTPAPVLLGTAAVGGIILLHGAMTAGVARSVRVRDIGGTVRGSLTITPSVAVAAADHVEVDTLRQYVTHVTAAGVRTNRYDWITAGDWFAFSPDWGDGANASPTIDTTSGTGVLLYRRGYDL